MEQEKTREYTATAARVPLSKRLFNTFGPFLPGYPSLSPKTMIARAERMSGLEVNEDDPVLVGLRKMCHSFKKESGANFMARVQFSRNCVELLNLKLRFSKYVQDHPELLKTGIHKPLFITGFPRTGTTILQSLLGLDPNARPLLNWEAQKPFPAPEPETYETDPRIEMAQKMVKEWNTTLPQFQAVHRFGARMPDEDNNLFSILFRGTLSAFHFHLPSYAKWLLEEDDATATYRAYKEMLQVLGYHFQDRHWLIKAPRHILFLEALLEVFPDANIIQTHRTIEEVLPSLCSLGYMLRRLGTEQVNAIAFGKDRAEALLTAFDRAMKAREKTDPARYIDVSFKQLVADPVEMIRSIYSQFGYEFTEVFEQRIRESIAAHSKDEHGEHHYSLEQFGLNEHALRSEFKAYNERFAEYL